MADDLDLASPDGRRRNLGHRPAAPEPPEHAIGRSRGGWSTKVHHLVDGNGRPLVSLVGPGQAGGSSMFPHLMRHLRIRRAGRGRARTRPDRVCGDKACFSRAIRGHLRDRGITAVIPEPADQAEHRKRRGSRGGRPPASDSVDCRGRDVIQRRFTCSNSGAGWPLATTVRMIGCRPVLGSDPRYDRPWVP
ncbi:transposase [Amycolatopsis sp. cmx-4-83]|uniref:transposase n=1 Tax=Amycolatopsis sp. cmx-4-83 TaxID=2790940 RepID=UPI00397910F7